MGKKISRFSITKLKGESKISEENALEVILKACLKFDIDVDAETDDKLRVNKENMLLAVQDFIMRGIVDINTSTWEIKHVLQDNYSESLKEITYKPVSGKTKRAMDGKDKNDRYEMMYDLLGACSGQGRAVIEQLTGIDLKVAEAMADFFL